MSSSEAWNSLMNHIKEMSGDDYKAGCLTSYGKTIVSPGEIITHEGMLDRLGDMNGEIKSQTDLKECITPNLGLKYINPCIEERQGTIEEIKEKRLEETRKKAIIGQWEQEKKYFSHITLPIKLFNYWKAKIA